MELLLVLILVGGGVWWYLQTQKRKQQATPAAPIDPLRRDSRGIDPRRLKVGDVVAYGGRDFLVRGTLDFDQDGFRWQEHLLDDANVRRWLSVEDDEALEVCLWEAVTAPDLEPGASEITWDGVTYSLDERGHARFRAMGTTGTAETGQVEYCDYEAGDRRLSFERYGSGSWEVGVGEVVNERSLDIYPAPADGG